MKRTALKRYTRLTATQQLAPGKGLKTRHGLKPSTKRMRQSRSTDKPTAVESARMELVKRLGCLCCRLNHAIGLSIPYSGPSEAHHLLSGGIRIGHDHTIGLCRWHHQAVPPITMPERVAIEMYGPSVATGSKPFHALYGTDAALLLLQNRLLKSAGFMPCDAQIN